MAVFVLSKNENLLKIWVKICVFRQKLQPSFNFLFIRNL